MEAAKVLEKELMRWIMDSWTRYTLMLRIRCLHGRHRLRQEPLLSRVKELEVGQVE